MARRHGDFAMVGAAAMVRLAGDAVAEARICLIGVADRPLRLPAVEAALAGTTLSDETLRGAAAEVARPLQPASDLHGSAAYRRKLAEVTAYRALAGAARRSRGAA